jgi:riboflavin synthase
MFTGIVTEMGRVSGVRRMSGGVQLTIEAPSSAAELAVSDSVSVNGVCQTVIRKEGGAFVVEAVEETLKKTTLGALRTEARVNLELPMRLNDRLGGHLVLGHVDCTGTVAKVSQLSGSRLIDISYPADFSRFLIPVGSIAVDGISLTVASLQEAQFTVSIIPHTLEKTTLLDVERGTLVNLEFDLIGKYVASMLARKDGAGGEVSWDRLREWGYKP